MLWGLLASVGLVGLGAEVLTSREERTLEDMVVEVWVYVVGCVYVCGCVGVGVRGCLGCVVMGEEGMLGSSIRNFMGFVDLRNAKLCGRCSG